MTDKHTPGPWEFVEGESNNKPAPDDCLGSIVGGEWILAEVKNDTPNPEANARLIAAAPELLKALEGVRRIVANQLDNALFPASGDSSRLTPEQTHVRERLATATRMARDAIKAAKGDA